MLKRKYGKGLIVIAICLSVIAVIRISAEPILEGVSFSSALYDKDGKLMRLTLAGGEVYRLYVPVENISDKFKEAVLMYEDKWFYFHFGVNPVSLIRAAVFFISGGNKPVGASTVTMQTARMIYDINSKSVSGKLKQIFAAVWLEIKYSKKDILEAYFNLAPYGHNIEGAEAAALIYFNVHAKDLTLFESFALAVIPQNPNGRVLTSAKGAEKSLESRKRIFPLWVKKHPEDKSYEKIINMPVLARKPQELPFFAPHFTDYLLSLGYRGNILTTLDADYQELMENAVETYVTQGKRIGINNAAALLIDYENMEVKAYVGSADYFNDDIQGQVNGVAAMRSPGSVLKPLIFGLGMDQGIIHPKSMMKDAPKRFGSYSPENSDRGFMGPIFAVDALNYSRNIPAIDLLNKLKPSSFYNALYDSGIRNLKDESFYGSALAIGGFEASMEDIVKIYAGIANFGKLKCINYLRDIKCEEFEYAALSPEAAFLTMDMLYYNVKPSSFKGRDDVAWKTGTSYAFRDGWTAGIFGKYVLAVWVGNFDGSGNIAFMGRSSAGELFFQIVAAMKYFERTSYGKKIPPKILNVRQVEICSASGDLPNEFCPETESGYFIPGVSPIKVTDVFRQIPIDRKTGLRACYHDPKTSDLKVYEFWPSDINDLFIKSGIRKLTPPKFVPDCDINTVSYTGRIPLITAPADKTVYNMYNGDLKDIPFTASADSDADMLYWFVDNRLAGSASPRDTFFWKSSVGEHLLTVTDNLGRSSSVNFSVEILPER